MTKLRYTKAQLKYFKEQGRIGGQMLKEKRGSAYYSKIGKLGVEARIEAKKLK
jgi:hypothetical protein